MNYELACFLLTMLVIIMIVAYIMEHASVWHCKKYGHKSPNQFCIIGDMVIGDCRCCRVLVHRKHFDRGAIWKAVTPKQRIAYGIYDEKDNE